MYNELNSNLRDLVIEINKQVKILQDVFYSDSMQSYKRVSDKLFDLVFKLKKEMISSKRALNLPVTAFKKVKNNRYVINPRETEEQVVEFVKSNYVNKMLIELGILSDELVKNLMDSDTISLCWNGESLCNLVLNLIDLNYKFEPYGLYKMDFKIVGTNVVKSLNKHLKLKQYDIYINEPKEQFVLMYYKGEPVTSIWSTYSKRKFNKKLSELESDVRKKD